MRRLWLLLVAAGCQAPTIHAADAGDAADAAGDAPVCAPIRGPMGVCSEPADEDGDCIPDSCDGCPNVFEKPPATAPGPAMAAEACTSVHAPFDTLTKRVLFEPFANVARWKEVLPELPPDQRLHIVDGAAVLGTFAGRVAWAPETASARDVIATTIVSDGNQGGGVILRFSETTLTGYVCEAAGVEAVIGLVRCTPGNCVRELLRDGAGNFATRALPLKRFEGKILVRGAVTTTKTGVTIECQVFPAPANADDVSRTLLSLASAWTVRLDVPSPALLEGAVGLHVEHQSAFESIDVLTAP